ncbi:SDR family NAD(P)-dependent oxidoreductase [Botrimarina sp.]|uniref:SDR family NAD(P)-dependent oxidoreductase n=1 Tax=Botrimarina sp. TaxID=2795802 RepID=UPI0032EDA558
MIGMACRLPGADGLEAYWRLLVEGRCAIGKLGPDRLDRDLYFDPRKNQLGKTYIDTAGTVDYPAFDPSRCNFPARLMPHVDVGHLAMCQVAAEACRHAGLDPFALTPRNTGVYLGNNASGRLATEIAFSSLADVAADCVHDVPAITSRLGAETNAVVAELAGRVRRGRPRIRAGATLGVAFHATANAVSESLGLTGPSMVLDAACSSSLKALALAAADLRLGAIDMAVVGGASFCSSDGLLIFSSAQAGSESGQSRPFCDDADGLVSAEGYVAILVKTLDRALADGDPIRCVVSGIGVSSDGRGKSLWAPRMEGQVLAMDRAYRGGVDRNRVAYLEAHATSTARGDQTELEAIAAAFGGRDRSRGPLLLGSVKANIGHVLEPAGLAGLVKAALVLEHRTAPMQIACEPLNRHVDWRAAGLRVPTENTPLPEDPEGRPLTAAVNAFGIGGLNAHVVLTEYEPQPRRTAAPPPEPAHEPVAVVGIGALAPGARTWSALADLMAIGADATGPTPEARLRAGAGDGSLRAVRGGYVEGFEYDWRKRRIAPKALATANPLQFMLLDCCDAALAHAGYTDDRLDRANTGVVVGARFESDFSSQLSVGFRLPHLRRELRGVLNERGLLADAEGEAALDAFVAAVLERMPALLDDTGSFTPSSLCSRLTKTLDLGGGATTIDSGDTVALAAVAQAANALRERSCSMVLCAIGSRAMGPTTYQRIRETGDLAPEPLAPGGMAPDDPAPHALASTLDRRCSGQAPGEGAAVLVMKRLADAQRDGDPIRAVIHGVGAGFAAAPRDAFDQAIRRAWRGTQVKSDGVALVELSAAPQHVVREELAATEAAYGRGPRLGVASTQFGSLGGASGAASLLRAITQLDEKTALAQPGLAEPIDERLAALRQPARLPEPQPGAPLLAGVSAWDSCGSAYHLVVERGQRVASSEEPASSTGRPSLAWREASLPWRIVRLEAPSRDALVGLANSAAADPSAAYESHSAWGEPTRGHRLAVVAASPAELADKLQLFASSDAAAPADPLARKGVFYAPPTAQPAQIAFLFPGQGSQHGGMLGSLVQGFEPAQRIVEELDSTLAELGYPCWSDLSIEGAEQLGVDVFRTQLSLLVADTIVLRSLAAIGVRPDRVAGHSFGEFAALYAAGAWTFREAARATKARCDAICACSHIAGGMLSAAADAGVAQRVCDRTDGQAFVANANAPDQTVIGGTPRGVELAERLLRDEGIATKRLAVNRPFHTPLLADVRAPLAEGLAGIATSAPTVPLLSSVSGEYVQSPSEVTENLVAQLTEQVRYVELVSRLLDDGVTALVECGPRNVLTGLHARRPRAQRAIAIAADQPRQEGVAQLLAVRACLEANGYRLDDPAATTHAPPTAAPVDGSLQAWGRQRRDAIRQRLRRFVARRGDSPPIGTLSDKQTTAVRAIAAGAGVAEEALLAYCERLDAGRGAASVLAAIEHSLPVRDAAKPPPHMRQRAQRPTQPGQVDPSRFRTIDANDFRRRCRATAEPGRSCERFLPHVLEKPLEPQQPLERLEGRYLVVGDNPVAAALCQHIQRLGGEPLRLENYQAVEPALAELDRLIGDSPPTTLCLMTAMDDRAVVGDGRTGWAERQPAGMEAPLAIAGRWLQRIKQADLLAKGRVLAATRLGGDFGFSGQAPSVEGAAIAALGKALVHEAGVPTDFAFQTTLVDFSGEQPPERVAELLLAEAQRPAPYELEVGYAGERRFVVRPVAVAASPAASRQAPRGTWVVTGGARGITALVAREIAERYGLRLCLIGSSPAPDCPPEWLGLDPSQTKALAKQVMQRAKSAGESPHAAWRSASRAIEFAESLRQLELAGIESTYHACDVSHHDALRKTLDEIRARSGPITGVLHGAGVEVSTRLETKDPAVVARTIAVKAAAAASLIELTRDDPLTHFIGFGSVTGRVGCPGQADYAMANELLAKLLARLQRDRPGCAVTCFDWGPWAEVGMAARPESAGNSVLGKLSSISPADGVRHALDELTAGDRSVETLLIGRDVYNIFYVDRTPEAQPADAPRPARPAQPAPGSATHAAVDTASDHAADRDGDGGGETAADAAIRRMALRLVDGPANPGDPARITGRALVVGDNPDADALAKRLRRAGVSVAHHRRLDGTQDNAQAERIVDRAFRGRPPTHVFLLSPRDEAARRVDDTGVWRERSEIGLIGPYRLLSAWLKRASTEGVLSQSVVVGVTSLGGDFGFNSGADAIEGAGLAGVLKAVHSEHGGAQRDRLRVKVVDAPADVPPEALAEAVIAEATGPCDEVEAAYEHGRRRLPRLLVEPASGPSGAGPRRGGVWVVTGGARGITAEVVRGLGKRYGLDLHLLGTRPLPQIDESIRYLTDEQLAPFKRSVVREAIRDGVKPEEAWGPWRRDFEIDRNLRRMREEGVRVTYHQCDVTDPARVAETLAGVRRQSGPINGLVHGAGIQGVPSNVRDMLESSVDSARRTVAIKFDAAVELLRQLRDDPLEHAIGFGSISGRFGSNSASFYCAGAEMLCKLMGRLRRQRPGVRAVGFHWHGWSDVGMIMRPEGMGTAKILKLELLSPADGVEFLLRELDAGARENEVVVTNAKYVTLYHPRELMLDPPARAPGAGSPAGSPAAPLIDRLQADSTDRQASVAETTLRPAQDPFLIDHRFRDRPLLPAAIVAELLAETAAVVSGGRVPAAIHDLNLASGLRLHSDTPHAARVEAELSGDHALCRLVADFRNRDGRVVEASRLHASGIVELADGFTPAEADSPECQSEWHDVWYPDPGGAMYHGPTFQRLRRCAFDTETGEGWGEVVASPIAEVGGGRPAEGWRLHPAVLDAGLYLCGIAVWFATGGGVALPKSFDRLRLGDFPRPGENCRVYIRPKPLGDDEAAFDIVCSGADGRLVYAADGYRVQTIGARAESVGKTAPSDHS